MTQSVEKQYWLSFISQCTNECCAWSMTPAHSPTEWLIGSSSLTGYISNVSSLMLDTQQALGGFLE
ncbi:MAG: hypothetical protein KME57_23055 [Scytonema hyalinum WJT4-NPBG1]|uniref:hypothetical protein n=1 Tax=Scytonema sp. PRP1 TaxID=3120513 RepID=UPI002FD0806E|nr:hypothetical protein [Scytonema hyalinum WJT4-NPBG1]